MNFAQITNHTYMYTVNTICGRKTVTAIYYRSFYRKADAEDYTAKFNNKLSDSSWLSCTELTKEEVSERFPDCRFNDQVMFPDKPMLTHCC